MITTTCTTCHRETSVPVTHGRVVRDPSGDVLALRCTRCHQLVAKPLTDSLTQTLLRHGATPTPSPLRRPHPERVEDPSAAPFTADDVLVLHELLARVRTVADIPALADDEHAARPEGPGSTARRDSRGRRRGRRHPPTSRSASSATESTTSDGR